MTHFLSSNRFLLLLLMAVSLTFTACEDDDEVIPETNDDDTGVLFLSSNTTGQVGVLNTQDNPLNLQEFSAAGMDADGIWYDAGSDNLVQVNRTNSTLITYRDVISSVDAESGVSVASESTSDFSSGRGLAPVGTTQVIVAQSGTDGNGNQNKLALYRKDNQGAFEFSLSVNVDFPLWGIQYTNGKLYAVVDKSDSLAVFNDFFSLSNGDTAVPDRYIKIDGLTRTHGLEYDTEDDVMILTDIGAASDDSDGGLFIIRNFSNFMGEVATAADYTIIVGALTQLGNPVDVDYDENLDKIYVAERAKDGGLLLVFDANATGNVAPETMIPFGGLSSLYLNR